MMLLLVMRDIHNLDLNLISTFCLLFETQSATKTAERSNVTQSAISHSLSKLRSQLNDPLFIKSAKGMQPTKRAEQLYEAFQQPLRQLQQAINPELQFVPQSTDRTFILAVSDYIEALLLPQITQLIIELAPKSQIRCVRINDFELTETAQNADLIFGRFKNPPQNFHQKRLWREEFITIAAANHPRITSNRIGLKQFLSEQHVVTSPTGVGSSVLDRLLIEKGLSRVVKVRPRYFTTPARIVAQSELISTVPARIGYLAEKELAIKCLKTPIDIPSFEINMLWGPVAHHDPAHQWLRQQILTLV